MTNSTSNTANLFPAAEQAFDDLRFDVPRPDLTFGNPNPSANELEARKCNGEVPAKPVTRTGPSEGDRSCHVLDVTTNFTAAARALRTAQLIKDDNFTLFESVGALEIMDRKMDSGFLEPGEPSEASYNTMTALQPEQVIGIIDQLFCYEMAWQRGYPLSQTLFTSFYIDALLWPPPSTLKETHFRRESSPEETTTLVSVLRAYCIGLIKSCDLIIENVTSKDYYEEEDFSSHTFNRPLLTFLPIESAFDVLDNAIHDVEGMQDRSKSAVERPPCGVYEAIIDRLNLRRKILFAISPTNTNHGPFRAWGDVLSALASLRTTHSLGHAVEESFSPKLQRKLASTVPPRPVVDLTFEDAHDTLRQLATDCSDACHIDILVGSGPSKNLEFMWTFSCRKPAPLAYPRSLIASVFMSQSNEAFEDLLLQDLAELVLPADAVLDPTNWTVEAPRSSVIAKDNRLTCAEIMSDFANKALPEYYAIWNSLCQNPCRKRRMLSNVLLRLDGLQQYTEALDAELSVVGRPSVAYPLSSWVYHLKLRCMGWVVGLGFEQDIYLPDELTGMYLWLSEISSTRTRLLQRIQHALQTRHDSLMQMGSLAESISVREACDFANSLYLEAKGTEHLAHALYQLYMFLNSAKLIAPPSEPYTTSELRYEVRMKHFLGLLSPRVPSHDDFEERTRFLGPLAITEGKHLKSCLMQCSIDEQLKMARSAWTSCKNLGAQAAKSTSVEVPWNKNLSGMLQSCVAAGLAHASLQQAIYGIDSDHVASSIRVDILSPEQTYHGWWSVPQITTSS